MFTFFYYNVSIEYYLCREAIGGLILLLSQKVSGELKRKNSSTMEFSSPAQRRLQTLRSHLDSSQADDQPSLFLNATASEAPFSNGEDPIYVYNFFLFFLTNICLQLLRFNIFDLSVCLPLRLSFSFFL